MMDCFITFRSVTPSQRGQSVLRQANVECLIQRTPRFMAEQGCGYSLVLRLQDVQAAVLLLKENGVPYRKVYRKKENGNYQELSL